MFWFKRKLTFFKKLFGYMPLVMDDKYSLIWLMVTIMGYLVSSKLINSKLQALTTNHCSMVGTKEYKTVYGRLYSK